MLPSSRMAAAGALLAAAAVAATAPTAASAQGQSSKAKQQQAALVELAHSKGLKAFVRAVSDPRSPRYRDYSTPDALQKRFGATPKAKAKTRAFLAEHGLTGTLTPSGQHLIVEGDAATVRAAFAAERTAGARSAGNAGGWTADVPAELRGAVTEIALLDGGPTLEPAASHRQAEPVPQDLGSGRQRTGTPSGCEAGRNTLDGPIAAFTPNQYLQAYGLTDLHERGLTGKGQRIAVIEIDGFARSDIEGFAECFGLKVPKINVHPVGIDKPLPPGDETTLDLEVLTAAAPGVEAIDVYEGGGALPDILQQVAAAIGKEKTLPDVISMSLDGCEVNYVDQILWARATDAVFAVAAGSGVSTFVATGDQGSTPCKQNPNVQLQPIPAFGATFPSTSPHVTAVGGTNITLNENNEITDQFVWNDAPATWAATSGGESLIFSRPWYQTAQLPRNLSNDSHRYTPDIAALADEIPGYAILCSVCGGWVPVGGTSAATPLMAGAVALVNESAAKRGQGNLGLINPLVYELAGSKQASKVLWDVTKGSNDVGVLSTPPVGDGQPFGCCDASKGFDPVSGWGSLKIPAFDRAAARAARG